FHANFAGNFISVLLLSILGGGIFLLIGFIISSVANSYEAAAPLTTATGMPFAFLGNIFFPVSLLPKTFITISNILPISHLANALRQVYLYSFDFSKIAKDVIVLIVWFVGLLLITVSVFRLKE